VGYGDVWYESESILFRRGEELQACGGLPGYRVRGLIPELPVVRTIARDALIAQQVTASGGKRRLQRRDCVLGNVVTEAAQRIDPAH
jgi:hypothetical protein